MHIGFIVTDLNDHRAMVCDRVNASYYGPHNNLAIDYTTFVFDPQSPTIPKIRDMLDILHINYSSERWS